jgi:protocatechuate 3,4-dioxygenase beta subunit
VALSIDGYRQPMDDSALHRRKVLQLLGGAGFLAIAGCASSKTGSSGRTTSTTTTAATATATATGETTTCSPIPQETAGPFPGDGSNGPNVLSEDGVVQRDITKSFGSATGTAEGIPITIELTLLDTKSSCKPLRDAAVYVWHCDREGRYSLYSEGATDVNYLRGVQASDNHGVVRFTSIFPACYSGRWPHVHLAVYRSVDDATNDGTPIATSQLAIPASTCNDAYTTKGYEASVTNLAQLSLASDMVFADDGGVHELATVTGDPEAGYVVALTIPV